MGQFGYGETGTPLEIPKLTFKVVPATMAKGKEFAEEAEKNF